MSETRTLTIEKVEKKEYNGKTYYTVTASGKQYSCKDDITQLIGQTGVAEVNSKQNGKYTNWYLNKFTPNQESQASVSTAKEDYFVLSYSKDLAVAAITSGQLNAIETRIISNYVLELYRQITQGLNEANDPGIPF